MSCWLQGGSPLEAQRPCFPSVHKLSCRAERETSQTKKISEICSGRVLLHALTALEAGLCCGGCREGSEVL